MRLRQIQDFLTVFEKGSIHAAARSAGLSQPAVTKSIRGLEAELQVQLVRRTNHGVVPTAAGRAFYARARAAHNELRKAEEELAQLKGKSGGSVAFGVGPVAALFIAPEAVLRFHQQFPMTSARIVEGYPSRLVPMVRNETLDFAMGPQLSGKLDPALAFRPLFREAFVIVGRKNHPLHNAGTIERLRDAMWVGGLWEATPEGALPRLFAAANLPPPRVIVHCDSYNLAVSLMAKSDTLGVLARRHLAIAPACDLLQEIAIAQPTPSFTIGLCMRKDPPLTAMATAMIKEISAVARQLAARNVIK